MAEVRLLTGVTDVLIYVEAPTMEYINNIRTKLIALPNLDKIQTTTTLELLF
ncbi:hypothetical protein [Leucothrix arctica]|uniref:hypothetical protein n=1 Tax=Leucothrix arctica TaxID=1481894 RepID=UPI003CCC63DF